MGGTTVSEPEASASRFAVYVSLPALTAKPPSARPSMAALLSMTVTLQPFMVPFTPDTRVCTTLFFRSTTLAWSRVTFPAVTPKASLSVA